MEGKRGGVGKESVCVCGGGGGGGDEAGRVWRVDIANTLLLPLSTRGGGRSPKLLLSLTHSPLPFPTSLRNMWANPSTCCSGQ